MEVKVFISIPMRGKSDKEIIEAIEAAKVNAKKKVPLNYEGHVELVFIDSFLRDHESENIKNKALACLGKSLELMAHADIVCFARGWKEARGCLIEHECAYQYGIHSVYL